MSTAKRKAELKFQDHIIASYRYQGGYARKWASDMQVGVPDLIAALPDFGCHLAEVKHRPDWALDGQVRANPLDAAQARMARKYIEGGSLVLGYVIIGTSNALGSTLVAFDPRYDDLVLGSANPYIHASTYVAGQGYDMHGTIGWAMATGAGLDERHHGAKLASTR